MMNQKVFYFVLAYIAIIVEYAFGSWSEALSFLCLLVAVDYLTGISASIKEGSGINSNKGFWGIGKKALMFVVIALLHRADVLLETDILMTGAVYFYIANELISIVENLDRLNFPMPPQLKQIIDVLKGKSGQK